MDNNKEEVEFLTIRVSKKRVVQNFVSEKEGQQINFSKILAPGGLTYIRKTEQIHDDKFNDGKVYFSIPKNQEINVQKRTDDVIGKTPEGKPIYKVDKYKISSDELKKMYDDEKQSYQKNRSGEQAQEKQQKNELEMETPIASKSR